MVSDGVPVTAALMRQAYVVSLSHIPRDGRVLRQIKCLTQMGWTVTAIGLSGETLAAGSAPERIADGVRHLMVPPPRWTAAEKRRAGLDLLVGMANPSNSAARARALRLPAVADLTSCLMDALAVRDRSAHALVIANDWMTLPAALATQERSSIPFHYDSHELAVAEHESDPRWRLLFPPTIAKIERLGIARARSVSTVSHGIARDMQVRYGLAGAPVVIRNVPDSVPLAPRPVGAHINVLYHGLFKSDRGLLGLIDSVSEWPDAFRLTLRGWAPQPAFEARLRDRVRRSNVSDRIDVVSGVPPDAVIAVAHSADIGIFVPDLSSLQNRYALPNKLFEYIHAGLAVVVPAGTDMAQFVREHACGLVLDEAAPARLACAFRALNREQITSYKVAAHRAALQASWAVESERLGRLLAQGKA